MIWSGFSLSGRPPPSRPMLPARFPSLGFSLLLTCALNPFAGGRLEFLAVFFGFLTNERERQTYFGAVNIATGECLIKAHQKGDGEHTIKYLEYLISQCKDKRIALIGDGAKYHCSAEVKTFLSAVNHGLTESEWKITCLKFAPNDPTQNPIEDIWLQAKRWIRECYHLCKTFAVVKYIFEFVTHCQIFDFPKLYRYGKFSQIK